MIKRLLLTIALVGGAGCPGQKPAMNGATVGASDLPTTVADLNKYIDDRWREQTAAAMENALVAADKAIAQEKNYETLWRAARAASWLADEYADRRLAYAEKGVAYAEQALALDSKRIEGQYYYGINLGQVARAKGLGGGRHLVPKVLEAGKAAMALDSKYDWAGPLRLVGALLATAPPPPSSVGDIDEGLQDLKRAIELANGFPLNHLLYADALLKNKDFDAAEREYNAVISAQPQPAWAARLPKWQKEAQNGLVKVRNARRGASGGAEGLQ